MLQPGCLPEGALAECFTDLDLCNILEKKKSPVSLFPQTEKEKAWEECELAAELCSLPCTGGCHTQFHHLATALCAPKGFGVAPD